MSSIRIFEGHVYNVAHKRHENSAMELISGRFQENSVPDRLLFMSIAGSSERVFGTLFQNNTPIRFVGDVWGDTVRPIAMPGVPIKNPVLLRLAKIFARLRKGFHIVVEEPIKGSFETKEIFQIIPERSGEPPGLCRSVEMKDLSGKISTTLPTEVKWNLVEAGKVTETWPTALYETGRLDYDNPEPWLAMFMALDQTKSVHIWSNGPGYVSSPYDLTMSGAGKSVRFDAAGDRKNDAFHDLLMDGLSPREAWLAERMGVHQQIYRN